MCVAKRYQYRLRDEVVNERYLEEIYDRELTLAEQYDERIDLLLSSDNCGSISCDSFLRRSKIYFCQKVISLILFNFLYHMSIYF